MTDRLAPYGSPDEVRNIAKVGKSKTPESLTIRMPSPDLVVKAGGNWMYRGERNRAVVRRNDQPTKSG